MNNQKGTSLVEIILVIAIIGFIAMLIVNLPAAINLIGKSGHQSLAKEIASQKIEDLRALGYEGITLGTSQINDSRLASLPAGSGTIVVEECLDICTNNELTKKVEVKLAWQESGQAQSLQMSTLISEGGLR